MRVQWMWHGRARRARAAVLMLSTVGMLGGAFGAARVDAAEIRPDLVVQSSDGNLWVDGRDTGAAMEPGTTPSVALSPVFGPFVAFQGKNHDLWVWNLQGAADKGKGMWPGTSPSITVLPNGGTSVAMQSNVGELWVDDTNTHSEMAAGTSPSLAFSPVYGPHVAFQGRNTDLWVWNLQGATDKGKGMWAGTSPSSIALPNGGVSVAMESNVGELWVDETNTHAQMAGGTNPALTFSRNYGPHVAFHGPNHSLWVWNLQGTTDWKRPMKPGTSPAVTELPTGGIQIAFSSDSGHLWSVGSFEDRDTGVTVGGGSPGIAIPLPLPVIDPTVPTPPAPSPNDPVVAFQASNGHLWVNGSDTGAEMAPGTTPAVAVSPAFGPFVAFQGRNTDLWVWNLQGPADKGKGMWPGTSPSITVLPNGGISVAMQSNVGELWVDDTNTHVEMAGGTNPSLAFSPVYGPFVAYQGRNTDLWLWNLQGTTDKGKGMWAGTSPSAVALPNGGISVAMESNVGELWVDDTNTHAQMAGGTNPALTFSHVYGPHVAFQGPNDSLWVWNLLGTNDWKRPMKPGTSPAVTELPTSGIDIAYQGGTGTVWTTGHGDTGRRPTPDTNPTLAAPPYQPPAPPPGSANRLSPQGVEFLHAFEGLRLSPYNDSKGYCTIAWGHLIRRSGCTDQDIRDWGTISRQRADEIFQTDIGKYEGWATQYTAPVKLNQHQFDAIVSFVYNLGPGNFSTSSVRNDILNGRFDQVPADMLLWDRNICGVRRRHASEGDLFANGDYTPRTSC